MKRVSLTILGAWLGASALAQDRADRLPAPRSAENERFLTADRCALCHDSSPNARALRDAQGDSVAPYDLWESTIMANAARDPIFRAALSVERAATPAAADAITAECARCHAPMGDGDLDTPLALDGVACTVCHQIQPDGLGTEQTFSGHFEIGDQRQIFGPHADPFTGPMRVHTGYTPVQADHVTTAGLCGSCHTLFTDTLDAQGQPTGHRFPEQTPFLEWRNSNFGQYDVTCQQCHMPTRSDDGTPIETKIAHNPRGFDFPPIPARQPVGRHLFVGGNTLTLSLLRDNPDVLQPRASRRAFNATIDATRRQLTQATAQVSFTDPRRDHDTLLLPVTVAPRTGHKFPTGHPSRRAFLLLEVRDASNHLVFRSGNFDLQGRLLAADGTLLPAERRGGPTHPHRVTITSTDEVQVYESVLADPDGHATFLLLRAASYLKDNRLLPRGWDPDHPDADATRPAGLADDPDFQGGSDTTHYRVPVDPEAGPFTVRADLYYQPLSPRYLDELLHWDTPDVERLRGLLEDADLLPTLVASETATLD